MTHLEIFDDAIHDVLEPTAIGCDALFSHTAIQTGSAASTPGKFACYLNNHCCPLLFFYCKERSLKCLHGY